MPPTLHLQEEEGHYSGGGGFDIPNSAQDLRYREEIQQQSSLETAISSICVDVDVSRSSGDSDYQPPSPGGAGDDGGSDDDMEYNDDEVEDPPYVPEPPRDEPPAKRRRGRPPKQAVPNHVTANVEIPQSSASRTLKNQSQRVKIPHNDLLTVEIPVDFSSNNNNSMPPLSPVILDPPPPPEIVQELVAALPSPPTCPHCGLAYENEDSVRKHIIYKHPEEVDGQLEKNDRNGKRKFECGLCGNGMRDREGYLRHLWAVHLGGPSSKEVGGCPFCLAKLGGLSGSRVLTRLSFHLKQLHPDKKNTVRKRMKAANY
jgi:hypothetical protein